VAVRKKLIRILLIMILLISIVFMFDSKQWEIVKQILVSLITWENGGLPGG